MRNSFLLAALIFSRNAFADCPELYITWPTTGVVYLKKNAPSGALRLPTRPDGDCAVPLDLIMQNGNLVESDALRDARVAAQKAIEEAAAQRKQTLQNFETLIDNAATLAQVKAAVKQILKAIVVEAVRN